MTKSETLKGYFEKYPFLRKKDFCDALGVPNSTIAMFWQGRRKISETTLKKIFSKIEKVVKVLENK